MTRLVSSAEAEADALGAFRFYGGGLISVLVLVATRLAERSAELRAAPVEDEIAY